MNGPDVPPVFGPLPDDLSVLGLPANALLVLDKLRFFYCRRGRRVCWPSDAELVRRTGLSIHQVRRALRRLEAEGLIARQGHVGRLVDGQFRHRRRFIELRFDEPGAGAQSARASAPGPRRAPARIQEVVVVEGESKGKTADSHQRIRQEPLPAASSPREVPLPPRPTSPSSDSAGSNRNSPCPAPVAEGAMLGPVGEAMTRVFARLGVSLPDVTPQADPAVLAGPSPRPSPCPSPPPPASREPRPSTRRTSLSFADLERLASGGDPVLQGELAARREAERRREASETVSPPSTTAELLSRLREDPSYVARAAQALALELNDERSWRGLHALCRRAFEGHLDPSALVHAYGKALGSQVRNPGAIFTLEASRWRPPMGS